MEEKTLFDKYGGGRHWEKHPTMYVEKFIDFLKSKDFNDLIVDLGCSNGRDVNVFSKEGFNILGIDYSEKEIEIARKNFPSLKFDLQNVESLKFENNSIGAFYMINVIHYVNKKRAIDEIFRTLKQKGYFFIHFNMEIIDKDGNLDYSHKEKDITDLISNFKIIHKEIIDRTDYTPVEHKHKIMELILQKE